MGMRYRKKNKPLLSMSKVTHVKLLGKWQPFQITLKWQPFGTHCVYHLTPPPVVRGYSCCMTVYFMYSTNYSTLTNCDIRIEHVSVCTPVSVSAYATEDMQIAVNQIWGWSDHWDTGSCSLVAVFSLQLNVAQGTLVNVLQALCVLNAELRKWDPG